MRTSVTTLLLLLSGVMLSACANAPEERVATKETKEWLDTSLLLQKFAEAHAGKDALDIKFPKSPKESLEFVDAIGVAFSPKDGWGNPWRVFGYFVEEVVEGKTERRDVVEIRSAGPDKKFLTADDLWWNTEMGRKR
ncbi:MAG: hypothetical protein KDB07_06020 [Planctomycetes bacterium]|nr:hypothetical protein [Planctomycetota bacterium]